MPSGKSTMLIIMATSYVNCSGYICFCHCIFFIDERMFNLELIFQMLENLKNERVSGNIVPRFSFFSKRLKASSR